MPFPLCKNLQFPYVIFDFAYTPPPVGKFPKLYLVINNDGFPKPTHTGFVINLGNQNITLHFDPCNPVHALFAPCMLCA